MSNTRKPELSTKADAPQSKQGVEEANPLSNTNLRATGGVASAAVAAVLLFSGRFKER